MAGVRVEDAQRLWRPETLYLNTASFGLPPNTAWDTLQAVLADWRAGRTSFEGWGEFTESARASFARLVGVPTDWIAVGGNTSSMVGLVASSLPDGARVISAEPESAQASEWSPETRPSSPRSWPTQRSASAARA